MAIKQDSKMVSPVLGGVAGAIAGAAIGVGLATVIRNEKTWESLKEEAMRIFDDIKKDETIRTRIKERIVRGGKLLQKKTNGKEVNEE